MLKLICLHSTHHPNILQSLTLGYTHILTRSIVSTAVTQNPRLTATKLQATSSSSTSGAGPGSGSKVISSSYGSPRLVHAHAHKEILSFDKRQQNYSTLLDIGYEAELLLGNERFSINSGMTYNFGNFTDIITLFSFKVAHIDHPLLHLVKILEAEFNNKAKEDGVTCTWKTNPYPLWRSMMILLATEMFGYKNEVLHAQVQQQTQNNELQHPPPEPHKLLVERQVRLSKIIEIAYITEEIHKRILDVSEIQASEGTQLTKHEHRKHIDNLHRANKAATLIGDLLWTQKMMQLGALKCQLVTGLICKFLMDYCESEFIFGINSTKAEQFTYNSWAQKARLSIGSLMGNTMSSMVYFSGHDDAMRERAYKLGCLLGMTYQAYNDIRYFERDELKEPNWLDVGLLPVVQKIQRDPSILNYSHAEIFDKVKQDDSTMAEAIEGFHRLQDETLNYIQDLNSYCESTPSRKILTKFIETLKL